MTVDELISKIEDLDPGMPVLIEGEMGNEGDIEVYAVDGECIISQYGQADGVVPL